MNVRCTHCGLVVSSAVYTGEEKRNYEENKDVSGYSDDYDDDDDDDDDKL